MIVFEQIDFSPAAKTHFLLAEEGESQGLFFHKSYTIRKGDLILKPANTLFSIQSISKDRKMRLIEFRLPQAKQKKLIFFNLNIISLSNSDFQRIKNLFSMICDWMEEKESHKQLNEYHSGIG